MTSDKNLGQRWYRPRELPTLPMDVCWWNFGRDGVVRMRDYWNTRHAIREGTVTHLWPIIKPLPPGMTEEEDV